MIEVEILGLRAHGDGAIAPGRVRSLCRMAAGAAGIEQGHLAVHFCSEQRIAELNRQFRGKDSATDVLSFPIDGGDETARTAQVTLELGDVFVHLPCCEDVEEVLLHGVLHLAGMDHEQDEGQMLVLQDRLMASVRAAGAQEGSRS